MPTFTLRPYATSGDWTAGLSGQLNDDLDTTYLYFSNQYQYGEARFNTNQIPWAINVAVKSIKVRARTALLSPGNAFVQVTAFTGTGRALISSGDSYFFNIVDTSIVERSTGDRVATLAQVEGDIVVILHPTSGADKFPEITELYLDVVALYPPSVTVNTPSGTYTTTSSPPLWFTYFSQEGLPQAAYRYLIYRDDQYGASGFVPGVTAADYDSGIVYGTANRVNLYPRVNDTYRVYVAVAQSVNGQLQWSPWVPQTATNFGNYVINITPPAAPTVTATADSANARIQVSIAGAGAASSVQDTYELQRSADSGVTWEVVRSDTAGGVILSVGGARITYDYESANGQSVIYRARTTTIDTIGNVLVGAWSSSSTPTSWSSTGSWLKVATRPELNMQVTVEEYGEESFPINQGVFQGLDSDTAVTVTGIRRSLPDGSIIFLASTAAERTALKAILATGETVLMQASSRSEDWGGVNHWLSLGDLKMARKIRGAWDPQRSLAMPYTEVERPDPSVFLVNLAIRTWQDIDDLYSTFTALSAAYSTYGAIRQ